MNEFVTAVYQILLAETGEDDLLEGVSILRDENEALTAVNVAIMRGREVTIEQANMFKAVEGILDLFVSVNVSKKASSELAWYNAEVACEQYARTVEKIIMNNATFVCTLLPNGLTAHGEDTTISEKDYRVRPLQSANFMACKMELHAQYIYKNGVISLR